MTLSPPLSTRSQGESTFVRMAEIHIIVVTRNVRETMIVSNGDGPLATGTCDVVVAVRHDVLMRRVELLKHADAC